MAQRQADSLTACPGADARLRVDLPYKNITTTTTKRESSESSLCHRKSKSTDAHECHAREHVPASTRLLAAAPAGESGSSGLATCSSSSSLDLAWRVEWEEEGGHFVTTRLYRVAAAAVVMFHSLRRPQARHPQQGGVQRAVMPCGCDGNLCANNTPIRRRARALWGGWGAAG